MTVEQIKLLTDLVKDLPTVLARMGKDGQQVGAFLEDFKAALVLAKKEEEKVALYSAMAIVFVKAWEGVKAFRPWNPSTYDVLKPMRLKCDDVARIANFTRYKKLRNL